MELVNIKNSRLLNLFYVLHVVISALKSKSDYRLYDRGSIPCRGKWFFLVALCPDQLWGHPASYPVGLEGKARPGRDADHSPPSSAEVKNK
jgi:hypothetical protein